MLLVQRSNDNGKEHAARSDVAEDLADWNVGIGKEDIDVHAQILNPVLHSLRVVPVHLIHADNLDVVDFATRPRLLSLTPSKVEHGRRRWRVVTPAAAVPSSVVSPSAAAIAAPPAASSFPLSVITPSATSSTATVITAAMVVSAAMVVATAPKVIPAPATPTPPPSPITPVLLEVVPALTVPAVIVTSAPSAAAALSSGVHGIVFPVACVSFLVFLFVLLLLLVRKGGLVLSHDRLHVERPAHELCAIFLLYARLCLCGRRVLDEGKTLQHLGRSDDSVLLEAFTDLEIVGFMGEVPDESLE